LSLDQRANVSRAGGRTRVPIPLDRGVADRCQLGVGELEQLADSGDVVEILDRLEMRSRLG
jgi:hypothetical protein